MLTINSFVVPSDAQWDMVINGMRNPLNSWDRKDSDGANLGLNDRNLMIRLIHAGNEHRKFLRQLPITVNITAPVYFTAELDTYKVGTVRNSCSLQHKGASKPFSVRDFSVTDETVYDVLDPVKVKREHKLVYPECGEDEYREYVCGDRKYKVFKSGKLISCDFARERSDDGLTWHYKGREVIPSQNPQGYYYVHIGGKLAAEKWMLHRLVAFVWHGEDYFDGADVNHKDGNKGNNSADNLEWVTHQENEIHKHANGLSGRTIHTDYTAWKNSAKTSPEERFRIRQLYEAGARQVDIAKQFNVSQSQVSETIRNAGSKNNGLFEYAHVYERLIDALNSLREKYVETGDYEYFLAMRSLVPMGYNYTFTWSANYEVLHSIYWQRKNHMLPEWQQFREWIETLPNAFLITEGDS